ncbi:MAG TPA: hypothetical protein G4O04_06115 [Anaerolineae bacterium]|nr:hypothetical protein [Anaerolineae bacterium]HID83681.1 hypothetical protein [Anaerolineales bacterium]HIQ08504.1 hypothetical protein [Anaerolineaceae bacterium]
MRRLRLCGMLCLVFLAVACSATPVHTRTPDADFSRGVELARSVTGGVTAWIQQGTLQVLYPQGGRLLHLRLPLPGASAFQSRLPDPQDVTVPQGAAILPQAFALPNADEALVTLVLVTAQGPRLFVGRLGPDGWRGALASLSPPGQAVRTYRAALTAQGDLVAFWTTKDGPDLWWRRWPQGRPHSLAVQATRWALAPLPTGEVALLWVTPEGALNHALLAPEDALTSPVNLAEGLTSGGGLVDELVAVASGERLFVAWEQRFASGLQAGTSSVWLAAFPWRDLGALRPQRVALPLAEHPAYVPLTAGPAGWSRWAALAPPGRGSDFVADPWLAPVDEGRVMLAVSAFRLQRLDRVAQIAVVYWTPHGMGYQAAARTPGFSQAPQLLTTATGQWLLWREGAAGDRLYLASTDPRWRAAWRATTWADVGEGLLQGTMEALVGAAMFPLALFWLLPGALVLALGALLHVGDLTTWGGRAIFLLAFVVYQVTKAFFLPGLFVYTPFSAWFDLPGQVATALRLGVPVIVPFLGLGVGVAWLHRRQLTSWALLFLVSAGVDALVTLMLYGVNFLGAFS